VVLTGCSVRHGRLTDGCLLSSEERTECILCNSMFWLTVWMFLTIVRRSAASVLC
jgi:hypothetical protein